MNLVNKGKFIIDSIAHLGLPDIIMIGVHSADFKKDFLERKGKTYEDLTLESLIEQIAGEKELKRISRNKATISVNLARGNPNLTAKVH